ncbi:uncharacterized protein VP01_3949g2, partial [Puccinia sorghi]
KIGTHFLGWTGHTLPLLTGARPSRSAATHPGPAPYTSMQSVHDGFSSIMMPLDQQMGVTPSSVQSIWLKKQVIINQYIPLFTSNFNTVELHLLVKAVCALTPSLHISSTHYSSPIDCRSPCYGGLGGNASGGPPPSTQAHLIPDNSGIQQSEPRNSPDLHLLSMEKVQPRLTCGVGHPWEPPPVLPCSSSSKANSLPLLHEGSIPTARCTNVFYLMPPSSSVAPNPVVVVPEAATTEPRTHNTSCQLALLKQASAYNHRPRKNRPKKALWLLIHKRKFSLETIPENQEWTKQHFCSYYPQKKRLPDFLPENSLELKSVFENDSDSEDESDH